MAPIYTFKCEKCGDELDEIYRIADCPKDRPCMMDDCSGRARKVVNFRAVHGDSPAWLDDFQVQAALQDLSIPGTKPLKSRSEYKRFLKERGICDSPKSGTRWI
jgi:hypothetical protein